MQRKFDGPSGPRDDTLPLHSHQIKNKGPVTRRADYLQLQSLITIENNDRNSPKISHLNWNITKSNYSHIPIIISNGCGRGVLMFVRLRNMGPSSQFRFAPVPFALNLKCYHLNQHCCIASSENLTFFSVANLQSDHQHQAMIHPKVSTDCIRYLCFAPFASCLAVGLLALHLRWGLHGLYNTSEHWLGGSGYQYQGTYHSQSQSIQARSE